VVDQPYGSTLSELLAVGANYCDLDYERLKPIVAGVQQNVSEMAAALSLELPDGREYVELLVEAHERLAAECVATSAVPRRGSGESSLLQLAECLRDDVARCVRGAEERVGHDERTRILGAPGAIASGLRKPSLAEEDRNEPTLEAKVAKSIQNARQSRQPVVLAVLEIDRFSELAVKLGPARAGDLIFVLRNWLIEWTAPSSLILLGESRLAMLWEDRSRGEAVDQAREVLWKARSATDGLPGGLSVSIGLAALESAPKNYPPGKLTEAALGCLSAAQLSGGNSVKSIAV
jgi:GGDEF domain-containing protein